MKRLLILGILGCFLFFGLTILASVPNLINYQGRLTDDVGNPITTATTVRFSLYQGGDATTPGSGTLVYEEDATVTPDDNGVFDHTIGTGTVVYGSLDSTVFQTSSPVYLEITVDPAGVSDTLLPRKQVVTVGYSFKSELSDDADTVDGLHASDFALVGHNHDADYVNEGQVDSVTSAMIADGTIVDADINASANIAASKINRTGLDADLLDGKDSLEFVHTTGDDMTGTLNVNTSTTWALYGTTSSTSGFGVYGYAYATSGTNKGVYGRSDSTSGFGVYGYTSANSGTNNGVYGRSDSTSGCGVFGDATASSGSNYGVFGASNSSSGYGVYGYNPAGRAGYFSGNVHVTGNLTVSGSKPCVQPIDDGKKVLLYAMESPEIWFEDFGTAKLVNGQAVVQIEEVFVQTANTELGYYVFLTPIGEWQGLYISRKDKDSFEVREQGGGTSSITFDYRIVAKRRGYEDVRFEEFTEPEDSSEEPKLPIEIKEAKFK